MRRLVLAGAGGFARETAEAVHAINAVEPTWTLLGFLDDDAALHGTTIDGLPVLGDISQALTLPDVKVVVCTGSPANYVSRKQIVDRLDLAPDAYATVVHPTAVLPRTASIGPGSVLLAGTVLTASVRVGAHVAVMPQTVLTHDDVVDDFATIASGVRLGGAVTVEDGAYLGAGALVREGRTVGCWSLVGMGAVVTCDIPAGEVWAGVPARRLRTADVARRTFAR